MALFPLHLVLAYFIIHATFLHTIFAYSKNETTDIETLLEFKSKISDPLRVMESWNESTPFCQWFGVTCGSRHKRVKAISLGSSKLTGTISPYIGNLSFLEGLFLQNNSFTGNIPSEIGRLRRIKFLKLHNNFLTGMIPYNISCCHNLIQMIFLGNHLEGEIPSSLGNLSAMEVLSLAENRLTGVIPDTLGQLNRLDFFTATSNRLSGPIPLSIFNLSSLSVFGLAINQIHGSLPPGIFNTLPNIRYFTVSANKMRGDIPISLSNASGMVWFETIDNKFTGKLPSLEKLKSLTRFKVSYNNLGNGGVGDLDFICSLTNNTKLEELNIAYNNFGGIIPKCIGNLTSVRKLGIPGNSVSGPIPTEIGNLMNIEVLGINQNQLSGEIPSIIGNLEKLEGLYLTDNKLSGNIPNSFGNLKRLISLSLGNNKLEGMIPHTLGECKSLFYLYLYGNDLVGSIPLEIFQISSLLAMNVSHNRLHGPLPKLVENLDHINSLDVSENMLSQTIPSSLEKCNNLQELFIQGNFFSGMIPPSLGSLRGIISIDLSRNNLSGQIPGSLANLMFLEKLNMSYNNLEGPVPEDGVFKNASRFTITGNEKLCGGISELTLPKCNKEISHKKASHILVKVVLGVLGGLLGMFFIFLWFSYRFRKNRNTVSQSSSSDPLLRLSYHSLLKATNDFASAYKLGSGSFGSVYKAILDSSGTTVAVKVFDLKRHGASRSFWAECEVLRRIRHRNLVKILTACSSIDFSGNEFKALVYEFMANGSLDDWLHPFPTREGTSQPQKHLALVPRLNIAIDIACALDYLHHQYEIPIIHRDLKPSNVLLDDEMIGHVGDFGLSKLLLDSSENGTSQTSSTGFKGTVGYIPPEYGMGTSVSTQGDVYSYGILLLEMFTGKRPSDDIFHGSVNINCFVKAALPYKVAEIVDPTLHAEMEELSNARKPVLEFLIAIYQIGVSCSASLPTERKGMRDVVGELKSVRKKFLLD